MLKETIFHVKRDIGSVNLALRFTNMSRGNLTHVRRDHHSSQKRPILGAFRSVVCKHIQRNCYICQKRPTYTSKETEFSSAVCKHVKKRSHKLHKNWHNRRMLQRFKTLKKELLSTVQENFWAERDYLRDKKSIFVEKDLHARENSLTQTGRRGQEFWVQGGKDPQDALSLQVIFCK